MAKVPVPAAHYFHQIPFHVTAVTEDANSPIRHYRRYANDAWNLLLYVERNLTRTNVYQPAYDRHMHRLAGMVMLNLVEAFERFLKEAAAVCIDNVAGAVVDDRLDVFTLKGQTAAAHFEEQGVGKALCESSTWLDCDDINKRFRRLLAEPNDTQKGNFYIFPAGNQQPASLRGNQELVTLIFQLRHTIVHNAGVITRSDAAKLSRLVKQQVDAPRVLWPEKPDVWYVKLYLDQLVDTINDEVGKQLATLMTSIHNSDPSVLTPAAKAQELANAFQMTIEIAGTTRNPT